jgi:hypothetical protein
MRIVQKPNIEDQIRFPRKPAAEGKGCHEDMQARLPVQRILFGQLSAQVVNG